MGIAGIRRRSIGEDKAALFTLCLQVAVRQRI